MNDATRYIDDLVARLAQRMYGNEAVLRRLAMCRIARGHALLQGPPGVGKTLLARSFAEALGGTFRRVQGTPDLLPTDLSGVNVFRPDGSMFEFQPGPLFTDVLLMDEVNRTGPKTQSALLEAMEERQVSVDGVTRPLAADFVVIATQNPLEYEGTYPLPESQIDRFLVRLNLSYAPRDAEADVLLRYATPEDQRSSAIDALADEAAMLGAARAAVTATRVDRRLVDYVLDLCDATRRSEELQLGLSTRAARAWLLLARVEAAAQGFDFVRADDVQAVATVVAEHRMVLAPEATLAGRTASEVLDVAIAQIPVPRLEGTLDPASPVPGDS
ncbi:MAG: AAA family ATPase [Pseudomonadota bacterium]